MVGKAHGFGDGMMTGPIRDQPVHLLAHAPVGRVALWSSPKLDHVHASRAFMSMTNRTR